MAERDDEELVADLALAGTAAAGAAVVVAANDPHASPLVAAFTELAKAGVRGWRERRQRRAAAMWKVIIRDCDPKRLERELRERADDPELQVATVETLRAMDSAIADEVIPTLARVLNAHANSTRDEQWLLRAITSALTRLTAAEFALLHDALKIARSSGYAHQVLLLRAQSPVLEVGLGTGTFRAVDGSRDGPRVLRVLSDAALDTDESGGQNAVRAPHVLMVPRKNAERLIDLVLGTVESGAEAAQRSMEKSS